jgi:hypothetical protein
MRMNRFKCWTANKWLTLSLTTGLTAAFSALVFAQTGNISPDSIEIDDNANLVDNNDGGLNGGTRDWILDNIDNVGTGCLGTNGVATCNQANITAHTNGVGHWNGVRVVDGAGAGEKDIFLGGSHFDDPAHWSVGPGNIGGAKFDGAQAYLANNDTALFMAMERLGFNGTTAWDFEFNALAPKASAPFTPVRSVGDKLFVFEMNGSGDAGFVDVFLYEWNGTDFDAIVPLPTDTYAEINDTDVAAGPWGYRDTKGVWQLGNLHALTFAEVALPIGANGIELPVNPLDCSKKAFVAIRTRASNEFSSDLKDAFPIFEYTFSGITASAAKTAESAANLNVTVTGTITGGTPNKQWQVLNTATAAWVNITGQTGTALTFPSGGFDWVSPYITTALINTPFTVAGNSYVGQVRSAQVRLQVSQTVGGVSCTVNSNAVTVRDLVAVDP